MKEKNKKSDKKKTEKRRIERENREAFLSSVYALVLLKIAALDARKKLTVQLSHTNGNRYVRFTEFGRSITILLDKHGNVELTLQEPLHADHREALFDFSLDHEQQNRFLVNFEEMIGWLLPIYQENDVIDFHSFMDYVSDEKGIIPAYESYLAEWHGVNETIPPDEKRGLEENG